MLINERLNHKPTIELRELGKIAVSAFYPAATHLYKKGDVPFIRCVDCINYPVISDLQNDTFERIPKSFIDEHSSIDTVKTGDIIITKVGSPCFASIVAKEEELALSRTVMGLKDIKRINPFYLLAFLRSYYGFSQLLRQRELTIQYQLTVERVKAIKIFAPSSDFQHQIERLVKQSHAKLKESIALYAEAENLLLNELGLRSFVPSTESTAVKSFRESFLQTGRLDAEYYQPTYLELLEKLKSFKLVKLGQYADIYSGFPWRSEYFIEDELTDGEPFVRIRDCKPGAIDNEELTKLEASYANEQNIEKAKPNDLVIGMDGIKYFYASLITEPCYVNQRVCQVRIKKNSLLTPEYALILINGLIGQSQLLREMTIAHTVGHITNNTVRELIIPLVKSETMYSISKKVRTSLLTKAQSKSLLETAKRAVEIAIEENEQAALRFIEAAR